MRAFPNPQLAPQWRDRLERFSTGGLSVEDFLERKAAVSPT